MSVLGRVRVSVERLADRLPIVQSGAGVAIVTITLLGVLARLVWLADRSAHFDEGRVAYWALHFFETGEFHYRFIVHGPLVQHLDAFLFGLVGVDDGSMRLGVAIIGGLLPLSILLLREHLRDEELVLAALFLAFNPVLLYYSRFYRSTVPVAAFAFVAFGLLVRLYDTRRLRYLHAASFFVALAFAAKENAIVYLVVWVGAAVSIRLHPYVARDLAIVWRGTVAWWQRNARDGGWRRTDGVDVVSATIGAIRRPFELLLSNAQDVVEGIRDWFRATRTELEWRPQAPTYLAHAVLAIAIFLVVFVFFYAPRAATPDGVGLWNALADGNLLPVLEETWRTVEEGYRYWLLGETPWAETATSDAASFFEGYDEAFGTFIDTVVGYAAPLAAFALLGAVVTMRYASRHRPLVLFTIYWGAVSVVGYPLGTDIPNPWITVNALVPLVVPAAVGLGLVFRWGREARAEGDRTSLAILAVLVLLLGGQTALVGATDVYMAPAHPTNGLAQFAQPGDDLHPTTADIAALSEVNQGTDVLVYGSTLNGTDRSEIQPRCTRIANMLPMEWYFARANATVTCHQTVELLNSSLVRTPPPVIITTTGNADVVDGRVPDYTKRVLQIRKFVVESADFDGRLVFFIDRERLNATS